MQLSKGSQTVGIDLISHSRRAPTPRLCGCESCHPARPNSSLEGTNEGTPGTKRPDSRLESGVDETWYRIPESRRASGGVRLSTVVTVASGQLRWISATLRVRMRVQGGRESLSRCAMAMHDQRATRLALARNLEQQIG